MAFRLFSQTDKPSSESEVSDGVIGDEEEEEGLKKELIFACII